MLEAPFLLFDLGIVILAGTVFAFIARALKQPLIVGYILAGIIIGPIFLNLIPDAQNIGALSELGIAFLLFAVGMQIDFSKIWQFKKTILLGGLAQISITALLVSGIMNFLGLPLIESVYIGLIVAFSSTAIVVKILSDSNRLASLEAKLIIGFALVQDMVAVIALPLLANPATFFSIDLAAKFLLGIVGLFLLAFVFSKKIFPVIMHASAKHQEVFYLTTVSVCFLFMFFAYAVDFSIAIGAFIGGLALARVSYSTEALSQIKYIRDLFATVFFVSLGIQLNLSVFQAQSLVFFPILLAIVFILNPLILYLITLYSGFGNKIAWFVGLSLAQASEFSFIIARQGLSLGQVSDSMYNIAIWVILISMVATPYLMNSSEAISGFFNRLFKKTRLDAEKSRHFFARKLEKLNSLPSALELKNHIIIAGGGVFGGSIATELKNSETVLVVDHDPDVLERLSEKSIVGVYGSRTNNEVWENLCIENAKALVVTIPDAAATLQLVKRAKSLNPETVVFARAHYFRDALELYNAKADLVVMPAVLGSNACLEAIQDFLVSGKVPRPSLGEEFLRVLKEKAAEEKMR
ncbi:MAG TPA: cation:proton antiporter [archaeon]|nr:cation:proton antiporter [archaeon]